MTDAGLTIDWREVSEATVLYLGKGTAPTPRRDRRALVDRFGDRATDLQSRIDALRREMGSIPVDWSTETYDAASLRARTQMHEAYPGLSRDAIDALGWDWDWGWR